MVLHRSFNYVLCTVLLASLCCHGDALCIAACVDVGADGDVVVGDFVVVFRSVVGVFLLFSSTNEV